MGRMNHCRLFSASVPERMSRYIFSISFIQMEFLHNLCTFLVYYVNCKCSYSPLWVSGVNEKLEKEKEMRKTRLILCSSLLAAATGIAAVSLPVNAQIRKELVTTDTIDTWNLNGPDALYAYRLYLESDEETKAHILEVWPDLWQKAADCISLLTEETASPEIRDLITLLRQYDPTLPELKPAAPVEPDPDNPDNPDQPVNPDKPVNPDNPDQPVNPDKPDKPVNPDNPDKPDDPNNSDNPDEKDPEDGKDRPDDDVNAEVSDKTDEEQKQDIEDMKTEGEINELAPASDPNAEAVRLSFTGFSYRSKNRKIKAADISGWYDSEPDYGNGAAWQQSSSAYNTPGLWGQCTWFAWGRFYEIYGFNPGFTGNGNVCADQLLAAHPDKFVRSDTPVAGSVFSGDAAHNHVGIILDVNPVSGMLLVQEGNLDGVSNPNWDVAKADYRTVEISLDDLRALYGNVVFANPIEGRVTAVSQADQPKLHENTIDEVRARLDRTADQN